jgi:Hexapeptide repeat of succinyl-transferase
MLKKLIRAVTFSLDTWRSRSDPIAYARSIGVVMAGKVTIYGTSRTMFGSEPFMISLGDNVHICDGVKFFTHDGGVLPFRNRFPTLDRAAPIRVGSNVFIGGSAIVLMGVTIGDDCVIGAGSVVTKDIPSGSVVAGNPARIVRTSREYLAKSMAASTGVGDRPHPEKVRVYRDLLLRSDRVPAADLDGVGQRRTEGRAG